MAGINNFYGVTNDYSYLFNNLSTTSSSKSSTNNNMLGIDFGEYASITRGSYNKLVKAYYAKYGKDDSESGISSKDSTQTSMTLKNSAKDLYDKMNALVSNGSASVFKKVEITDEETGKTSMDYDKDKVYSAVNDMVKAYNSMVESSTSSNQNSVLRKTLNMINSANANGSLLSDVGISIGSDNKLSISEDAFKNADMSTVKTLFNGRGSLGDQIQSAASNIYMSVNNSLGNSSTYTSAGSFGNYTTGNILDSLL